MKTPLNVFTVNRKYKLLSFIVLLNLFTIIFLKFAVSPGMKVDIKLSLFSTFINNAKELQGSPEKLSELGFLYDKSQFSSDFNSIDSTILYKYKLSIVTSNLNLVKKIVNSFSKGQSSDGCGFYSQDIIKNIEWVSQKHGCCSDYSQVFIALANLNGIFAREVHHESHTFNEYWDKDLNKWVWVDPNFLLMAKDEKGKYLSLFEIRDYFFSGKIPNWEFIGNENEIFFKNSASEHNYYKPNQFQTLIYTNGNNVFQESEWNLKLNILPKEIRQFVLYIFKKIPRTILVGENSQKLNYFKRLNLFSYTFLILWMLLNFFLIRKLINIKR